ncbi:Integral membrane protein TerC [Cyanobacterium stanieri PCC 7202]|uniref:Integral membrane protein TerC n=1 Tax=Cyanobacterium stanieri (strain ATCC 29140 / PCC 7202) TaxID=292563 RepID=K9YKA3_CYASC|nr:Integral membrane protein TerC [Cyanobacterium stanieri PCC 7202]
MLDQVLHPSIDFGIETAFILVILVALEAVLSADNAIALAAIAQGLKDDAEQKYALNVGLILAYILRITLIITATWVIQFWQFSMAGGLYLLWLVFRYYTNRSDDDEGVSSLNFNGLWQAIPMIAVTDLAFSLDSVTTAIAVAEDIWLIIAGGTIGVITLRFLAQLFIRWIQEYTHLEDAGFITVGLVGLRLIVKVIEPNFVPPEWVMIITIISIFTWGFSAKNPTEKESPER